MSLSEAVRELNLVKEDRDMLRTQLQAKETEITKLKNQVEHLKLKNRAMNNSRQGIDNGPSKCTKCNSDEVVEFVLQASLSKFEKKFDNFILTLEKSLHKSSITLDSPRSPIEPEESEKKLEPTSDSCPTLSKPRAPNFNSASTSDESGSTVSATTSSVSALRSSLLQRAKISNASKRSLRYENDSGCLNAGKTNDDSSPNKLKIEDERVSEDDGGDLEVSSTSSLSKDSKRENVQLNYGMIVEDIRERELQRGLWKQARESLPESISPPWTEVIKFAHAPAFDLDSPVVMGHLKTWTPNSEKRLYLCQWLQRYISDLGASPSSVEDLMVRGMSLDAKESFLVILVPILRTKRPDLDLYTYCRKSSLSVALRDLGGDDGTFDILLTTSKVSGAIQAKGSPQDTESNGMLLDKNEKIFDTKNNKESKAITFELKSTPPRNSPPRPHILSSPRSSPNSKVKKVMSPSDSRSSRRRRKAKPPTSNKSSEATQSALNEAFIAEDEADCLLQKPPHLRKGSRQGKEQKFNKNVALTSMIHETLQNIEASQGEI